ncbi:MAG: bifunctional diguanylate cyclase/phosphodiesterase [Armatimonadota bacterium]|nr:bifunctional diguanylate cyclase/phosphodiesterase [Armatimonadota bacterium]
MIKPTSSSQTAKSYGSELRPSPWLAAAQNFSRARWAPLAVSGVVAAALVAWLRMDHHTTMAYTPFLSFGGMLLLLILAVRLSRNVGDRTTLLMSIIEPSIGLVPPHHRSDQTAVAVQEWTEAIDLLEEKAPEASRTETLNGERPATHLPDRAELQERLAEMLIHCQREGNLGALILLSVGNFYEVTSAGGVENGIMLIDAIEGRLLHCTRKYDFLSHVGLNQFAIAIPHIRWESDAIGAANKLVAALAKPISLQDQVVEISCSAGVSLSSDAGQSMEELIRCAEMALATAEKKGAGGVHLFKPLAPVEKRERSTLEKELKHALNREEFELYYQPKVDLNQRIPVGMEALIRWNHPGLGLLPPGQFLQVAEETGFIMPLTEWVLDCACQQAKFWQDAGLPPLQIAVNLPERLFREKMVAPLVVGALARSGMEAKWLEVEITEKSALYNSAYTVRAIHSLQEMGVQVVMEKFGTGYGSLSALKRLPFDTLKVDPLFVRNLGIDASSAEAIESLILLSKDLGRGIVAEGVETERQLIGVRNYGCHQVQGFLISKPLPAGEMAEIIRPRGPRLPNRHSISQPPESLLEVIAQYSYVLPPKFVL